jgi:DNA-binding transcriptional LysR family regulator
MEFQHLRSFLAVSSELSFTRAAKKLHYAQSSVTAQIQQLEESLGTRLFDRNGRQVSLTEGGLRLRPVAERIIALTEFARLEVAGAEAPPPPVRLRSTTGVPVSRRLHEYCPGQEEQRPRSTSLGR